MLSISVEDYLKAIFDLTQDGAPASTTELALRLGVAPPSVSGMVRRLALQGLVDRVPYRGVELTEIGRQAALQVIRRHRVIETYLVQCLGLGWHEVHAEAERLEHAVSERVLERMAESLSHPEFDPHGDPIPTADGVVPSRPLQALSDIGNGQAVVLQQVLVDNGDELRYLADLGLVPGASVVVREHQPVAGVVHLTTASGEQVVGDALASKLLCTRNVQSNARAVNHG